MASVLVIVTKLALIKTPFTKGKLKSSSANGEYPFASDFEKKLTVASIKMCLLATNFMLAGLGVISAYIVTGTFIFLFFTKLRIRLV
jgi:hypothetical protein